MNQKEESIFYELLRAALWGTPVHPEKWGHEEWLWKNILKNLERQTILGLCTDVILRLPAEYLPDAEQQQLVQGRYMNNVKKHFLLNAGAHGFLHILKTLNCKVDVLDLGCE